MFNKLKQFKDLRSKAKNLQGKLAEVIVEGSASFGKIKVRMDGNQEVQHVHIDPTLISTENQKKLEEGVKDAFNDAVKKAQRKMAEQMKGMEGFDMPGLS